METGMNQQEMGTVLQEMNEKLRVLTQKNSELSQSLVSLAALTHFESTLTKSMLQSKFFADRKSRSDYQKMRETIVRQMKKDIGQSDTARIMEQNEAIRGLTLEIEELQTKLQMADQREASQKMRCQELERVCKERAEKLQEYSKLVTWHEQRIEAAIAIRENSRFFKPSLQEALAEFEEHQPKPRMP
jgi:hypothetical protein